MDICADPSVAGDGPVNGDNVRVLPIWPQWILYVLHNQVQYHVHVINNVIML